MLHGSRVMMVVNANLGYVQWSRSSILGATFHATVTVCNTQTVKHSMVLLLNEGMLMMPCDGAGGE